VTPAAVVVSLGIWRTDSDGLVKVTDSLFALLFLVPGNAAAVEGGAQLRIELDGQTEIGDCDVELIPI
jgi:hypothetical protein